ncbi:heavy-metal-associated domain-containing protein [Actinomarinicola tropica]|uniref:Cation-transporting ATPase n=1 Tax=Actinomarinicola tropica TaxID=2789776 RepID=A0A5Q2RIK0_9ACTN|nr:cation transporter [Actinomarinicola tropica]QGG93670.1 cation-transporting ATPase [Actinomarinicola tropica]
MSTATYTVQGMTCDHCVQAVRSEIEKIDGVTGVAVDLDSGSVAIESAAPVDDAAVRAAVDEAGYELAS